MEQETTTTLPNSKLVYTQEGKVLEKESPKIITNDGGGDFFLTVVLPWLFIFSVVLIPFILLIIPRTMKSKNLPLLLKLVLVAFYLLMVIVFFWAMFEHFI